ncbi:MAG: hypothetical protein ACYTFW_20525 [Planctomycetota bacterium]|jgi:hypothetical protein
MTSQDDFLKQLLKVLGDCSVPYMISGSFGSSFHGQPRATKDIDIVIAPTEKQLLDFVESLGKDYYFSLAAVQEALAHNSMFNIIDSESGWKADFILRKDRPFSKVEFQRRQKAKIMDLDVWIVSPEDVILSKLEWAKNSESGQQFRDALGVAVVQWDHLDEVYLHKWAKELQVESSLEQLLKQVKQQLGPC